MAFSIRKLLGSTSNRSVQTRAANKQIGEVSRRDLLATSLSLPLLNQVSFSSQALAVEAPIVAPIVPKTQLAGDLAISQIIKGCWQLSGGHKGEKETDRTYGQPAVDDFKTFYDAGITSFDAADHYGPAEILIGRFLKANPGIRGNVQLLSKLCVFSPKDMLTLNKAYIEEAVDTSRQRMGVDSVDLMQFYWGDYGIPRYADGAAYLADMQAAGKIKHIGVTNFDVPRMQAMVDKGVRIVSHQVQYSLLDTRPENYMVDFCKQNDIKLLTYGVLAGGLFSEKYLGMPANKVKADTYSKGKYGSVIAARGGWAWFQELLEVLDKVAKKHNTTISTVAARWVLDKPQVGGLILGARNASHVNDQLQVFNLSLDDDDKGMISEVLAKGKAPQSDCYSWERGGQW